MAPKSTELVKIKAPEHQSLLDHKQTLRASTALIHKINTDKETQKSSTPKPNLLDAEDDDEQDGVPIWLILTTKKHIVDKKRLKPGKIALPRPYLDVDDAALRICLITADPQRKYKDLIAQLGFPLDLAKRIHRVIGIAKLKAKYKSYESRRQLLSEYDVFLADDRVITYLPQVLGKIFYKSSSKRPIPVSLEGKKQDFDEQGNKRRKLSEGGTKAVKVEVKPADIAREIQKTLTCALVHLAPSTTTAVKVGKASMSAGDVQENITAVVEAMTEKYVPQKWRNVRAVHIKGPNTAALPIWLAQELWEDEQDVLEEALPQSQPKKRKRGALAEGAVGLNEDVITVPGPDGVMRRLERPTTNGKRGSNHKGVAVVDGAKDRKTVSIAKIDTAIIEKAEKAARKEELKKQKAEARAAVGEVAAGSPKEISSKATTLVPSRKARMRAEVLI